MSKQRQDAWLTTLQHELHVWFARPGLIPAGQLAQQYHRLLDPSEQQRYKRFYFEPDRLNFLAAHALLRLTLSRYMPCPPELWRFAAGVHGKPELDSNAGLPSLHFNLSHTKGMVACVVALDCACGIDVEAIRPMRDLRGVAGTVFSPRELSYLDAQPAASQPDTFFSLWTLKEAYIKATGLGMSAPLRHITFDLQQSRLEVHDESNPAQQSGAWLFDCHKPAATHRLALAAQPAHHMQRIVYHELDLASGGITSTGRACEKPAEQSMQMAQTSSSRSGKS